MMGLWEWTRLSICRGSGSAVVVTCSMLSKLFFMHFMATYLLVLIHWAFSTSEKVPSPFLANIRYSANQPTPCERRHMVNSWPRRFESSAKQQLGVMSKETSSPHFNHPIPTFQRPARYPLHNFAAWHCRSGAITNALTSLSKYSSKRER